MPSETFRSPHLREIYSVCLVIMALQTKRLPVNHVGSSSNANGIGNYVIRTNFLIAATENTTIVAFPVNVSRPRSGLWRSPSSGVLPACSAVPVVVVFPSDIVSRFSPTPRYVSKHCVPVALSGTISAAPEFSSTIR